MKKNWTPLPLCLHLFDFSHPLFRKRSQIFINFPPTPYKNSKSCDSLVSTPLVGISIYKCHKNVPLI